MTLIFQDTDFDFFSFLLLLSNTSVERCMLYMSEKKKGNSWELCQKCERLQPKVTEWETAGMGCCDQVIFVPFLFKSTQGDGSVLSHMGRWLHHSYMGRQLCPLLHGEMAPSSQRSEDSCLLPPGEMAQSSLRCGDSSMLSHTWRQLRQQSDSLVGPRLFFCICFWK